jgi:hypothetical protein
MSSSKQCLIKDPVLEIHHSESILEEIESLNVKKRILSRIKTHNDNITFNTFIIITTNHGVSSLPIPPNRHATIT